MKSNSQVCPQSFTTAITVLATVFVLSGIAFLVVHVSLANPMLTKALRDLPHVLAVCYVGWYILCGAPWARWVALTVSIAAAALLIFGFLGAFYMPSPEMSFVSLLYCILRPAIALCYIVVALSLLFYRPVVTHFRQTLVMTNDPKAEQDSGANGV
jgi:hypothetical protein